MDLRQIMYFMTIYEEGSFTKAASKLGVAQPALSVQIRRLEEEFRGPVFVRTARGVSATDLGRSFYDLCQPIRSGIGDAKQRMLELATSGHAFGKVACGFPPSYFKSILAPILADFTAQHEHVDLSIREGYGGTLRDWVSSGELDFAFGAAPPADSGLVDAAVVEEEVALVSSVPFAGPSFRPCDLSRLSDLNVMLPSEEHVLGTILREHIQTGLIRPARTMIVDSYLGVMEVARCSDWIAFVPATGLWDEINGSGLFIYPIRRPFLTFRWHVVHAQGKPLTRASRLLIDAITRAMIDQREAWVRACRERVSGSVA
jgi:LysR family transcriptional regulator, nitrogen assimilation regulatory protein